MRNSNQLQISIPVRYMLWFRNSFPHNKAPAGKRDRYVVLASSAGKPYIILLTLPP